MKVYVVAEYVSTEHCMTGVYDSLETAQAANPGVLDWRKPAPERWLGDIPDTVRAVFIGAWEVQSLADVRRLRAAAETEATR